MAVAMKMVHDADPAEKIVTQVGDLSQIDIFANQVLVGLYERPEKTKSGLFLADTTRAEDEHQGKVGLVLKLGPKAFEDDADHVFSESEKCKPRDWVVMWVTDGRKIKINGQLCRIVRDTEVRMRINEPDVVY